MAAGQTALGNFACDRANLAAIEPDVAQRTGVELGERPTGRALQAVTVVVGNEAIQCRGEPERGTGDRLTDSARTLHARGRM